MYCILTYVFLHQHCTSKRSCADKENELNVDNEEDKSPPSRKFVLTELAADCKDEGNLDNGQIPEDDSAGATNVPRTKHWQEFR